MPRRRVGDDVARDVRRAAIACGSLAFVMVATLGWLGLSPLLGVSPRVLRSGGIGLAVVSIAWLGAALHLSGAPVKRRSRYDGSMMFFVIWFFALFGVLMPGPGSIICLVIAAKRFGGTFGAVTLTFGEHGEGGTKSYPKVVMNRRETAPLGLAYLMLGSFWPAILFLLFREWLLPS